MSRGPLQHPAYRLRQAADGKTRFPTPWCACPKFRTAPFPEALQPGSRTLLTETDMPNSDGALSPGIYCTIELHKTPSCKVSADAIIFNEAGLQVAMVRDLGQQVQSTAASSGAIRCFIILRLIWSTAGRYEPGSSRCRHPDAAPDAAGDGPRAARQF